MKLSIMCRVRVMGFNAVSFIGGGNRMYPEKTIDLPQVTDQLDHIMLHRAWVGFELTTSVVIWTDDHDHGGPSIICKAHSILYLQALVYIPSFKLCILLVLCTTSRYPSITKKLDLSYFYTLGPSLGLEDKHLCKLCIDLI
jgi:hypothetical protein